VTPEEKLERLWSVHEIRQLAYRYAYAHDACDAALLESLWDEFPEPLELPAIDIHRVRAVHIPALATRGPSMLLVGNHIIDFEDEDNAVGTVYCVVQFDVDGAFVDQSVLYRDRYVRRDGRWLFSWRRHLLWHGTTRDRHPFEQPPANWPDSAVGAGTAAAELRNRPAPTTRAE
jgi:hypothetical protein